LYPLVGNVETTGVVMREKCSPIAVQVIYKCMLSDFAYFIGLDVHLLETKRFVSKIIASRITGSKRARN
jgi:hypothetical protein